MSGSRRMAVIGGGVIGAACAHYLAEAGCEVTIIERERFAGACSHGNCGLVCPSHVLPLAEPGALGMALKSLFARNSPFAVRLRFDPALWSWFLRFARRCNQRDMLAAGHALQAILASSLTLFEELVTTGGLECEWERRGLLFAYRSPAAFEAYATTNRLLGDVFGEPAVRYSGDEVARLEPALVSGLAGGWHYEHDAHLRPDKLLASWRRSLESRGVRILERTEFRGFATAAKTTDAARPVTAAVTSQGEIAADGFVVAAGAMTPLLATAVGVKLPIQPGKGYSLTMPRPEVCPAIPLIFPETRVAVTPMQSGYRLGSTMEFGGYDTSIQPKRLQLLRDGAAGFLRQPTCEPVEETWFGWRPMTPDSLPFIGRSPAHANVWVAAGHNMLGLTLAPSTGKLVSELVLDRPPHIDPVPYALNRKL